MNPGRGIPSEARARKQSAGVALGLAFLAIMLSACESAGPKDEALGASLGTPLVDNSAPAAPAPAEPATEAPAGPPSEGAVTEAAPETAALPPEPTIDDDPAQLIGLTRAGLGALLGDPALVRREPPAEIWQYRGETCVFDVFLYEDYGEHRVTFLEARDTQAEKIDARPCLNQLLRAHLGLPLGSS